MRPSGQGAVQGFCAQGTGRGVGVRYSAIGKIRGNCGHRHGTVVTAQLCVNRDQETCNLLDHHADSQLLPLTANGGNVYTDRRVMRENGDPLDKNELADLYFFLIHGGE